MGKRVFRGLQLKDKLLFLAILASIVFSNGVDGKAQYSREISLKINRMLKSLNKPAVKSIQSEDGDIVDCVDIYKQLAFDHPALKNHTIQMKPSHHPAMKNQSTEHKSSKIEFSQTWHKSGSCPEGTVPIRRIRKKDLLRAASLENFGRKNPQTSNAKYTSNTTDDLVFSPANRSAAVLIEIGSSYLGAQGALNLWNPSVESHDDYTSAQVKLRNGPTENYESIEAGWIVNPTLYGDTLTRFYAYWTADSSKSTGCFNIVCSGFVQTNIHFLIGTTLQPLSVKSGNQYVLSVSIFRDPSSGNWWLSLGSGDRVVIGYWPGTIFKSLKQSATMVEWGGEVYSTQVKVQPHTATNMGSGVLVNSTYLYGVASFVNQTRITDDSLQLQYPPNAVAWADEHNCYSVYNYIPKDSGKPLLFFGGPGRHFDQDPQCI